jgi:hypothetical protein
MVKVKRGGGAGLGPGPEEVPIQTSEPIEAVGASGALAVAAREHSRLNARITALQTKLKALREENTDLRNTIVVLNANLDLLRSNRVAWIYVQ